jgi:hypothetical protein
LSQADGLRYCLARGETAFSSLKKYASHFFNPAFGDTEEKEAAYAAAGVNSKKYSLNYSFLIRKLYSKNYTSILKLYIGLRKIALRNLRNEALNGEIDDKR